MDAITSRLFLEEDNAIVQSWLTRHAHQRVCQRRISPAHLAYVMDYGRVIYKTGVLFYFLGYKDLPVGHRHSPAVQRLVGITVVASEKGQVITAYKSAKGLRQINRKSKLAL